MITGEEEEQMGSSLQRGLATIVPFGPLSGPTHCTLSTTFTRTGWDFVFVFVFVLLSKLLPCPAKDTVEKCSLKECQHF